MYSPTYTRGITIYFQPLTDHYNKVFYIFNKLMVVKSNFGMGGAKNIFSIKVRRKLKKAEEITNVNFRKKNRQKCQNIRA